MPFDFRPTPLPGVLIIQPHKMGDDRGFFMETYKRSQFMAAGIQEEFHQDNHSFSSRGVLRGLHFQKAPHAQGKLVRVLAGAVWDVAVDLVPGSPNYGKYFGLELNDEKGTMLYIPPGFAHGFLTLRDGTHFLYKCTAEYVPEAEGGVRWDDPDLMIPWPQEGTPLVSDKDACLPLLKELSLWSG